MDKKKKGHLYFIREKDSTRVKIGYTTMSLNKRLSTLQVGCPTPLYVEHSFEVWDPKEAERTVHFDLKLYKERGEWYELSPEDLQEYIEAFVECRLPDFS